MLFLEALGGVRGERPPIWFMRQAGRSLPEYRALRAEHEMLDLIRQPELAAEVTLQPIRRFGMDAAIIFADILNPLIGMGMDLEFEKGSGPRFKNPVRTPLDVEHLEVLSPNEVVPYTLEALGLVRQVLDREYSTALIGFAGAPFTLSYYMIEGGASKNALYLKSFMYDHGVSWQLLQDKLVQFTVEYLCAQVEAGAQAVQLFDSWVGLLSPAQYLKFAAPSVRAIVAGVRERTNVPIIYLAMNSFAFFGEVVKSGADALSIDWRQSLSQAAQLAGPEIALQGNLDPALLACSWEALEPEVDNLLEESKGISNGYVFNLGHGVLPESKLENLERTVAKVKAFRFDS